MVNKTKQHAQNKATVINGKKWFTVQSGNYTLYAPYPIDENTSCYYFALQPNTTGGYRIIEFDETFILDISNVTQCVAVGIADQVYNVVDPYLP